MSAESDLCATFDNVANIKIEKGCDELLDHMCEVCEVIDESRQVFGYCNQCQHYLCHRCTRQHAKVKATTGHSIIAIDDLNDTRVAKYLYEGKLVPLSTNDIPEMEGPNKQMISPTYIEVASLQIDGSSVNAIMFRYYFSKYIKFHAFNEIGTRVLSETLEPGISSMLQSSVDENVIFFNNPTNKSISKFKLETARDRSSLKIVESFKTSGQCFGMTNFNDGLAVIMKIPSRSSNVPAWQLQYLDNDIKIKQRLCYCPDGKALFTNPVDMETNNEQTVLFVLEKYILYSHDHILALNVNGEILYKIEQGAHRNDFVSFRHSYSLAIDDENNIYVACKVSTRNEKTCTFVQIHSDTSKSRELFISSSTITHFRFGFNKATRTLLVAEDNNAEVTYYSLC